MEKLAKLEEQNTGQKQASVEQSIHNKKSTILHRHQIQESSQQLQHAEKTIKGKQMELLDAQNFIRSLQS